MTYPCFESAIFLDHMSQGSTGALTINPLRISVPPPILAWPPLSLIEIESVCEERSTFHRVEPEIAKSGKLLSIQVYWLSLPQCHGCSHSEILNH